MKYFLQTQGYKKFLILTALLLSSCAHMVNTLDKVEAGMEREKALGNVQGNPTPYFIKDRNTEYVLYRVTTSLFSMYSDSRHDVLFVKFENQKVVDKGVVSTKEEVHIKKINPSFELRIWQEAGALPADQIRE